MASRRSDEDVELNVASMLDMAFQLLTFFILTFKASPLEGQISLHMPPPHQVVGPTVLPQDVLARACPTLRIGVDSSDGSIDRIDVGIPGIETSRAVDLPQLKETVERVFRDSAGAFEQVVIEGSPRLYYRELMKVVEACHKAQLDANPGQKVAKLSFVSRKS